MHALAQDTAPGTPDCPECDALVRKVADDRAEVEKREEELRASESKEQTEVRQRALDGRQNALKADEEELKKCRLRCKMLKAPLPPVPSEVPIVRHPEPTGCAECQAAVARAKDALKWLAYAEINYLQLRSQAVLARAWLVDHAGQGGNPEFFANFTTLVESIDALPRAQSIIREWQAKFDYEMDILAKCNAARCKDKSSVIPGTQPLFGPAGEYPQAACPQCEDDAVKLKARLRLLQYQRMRLELETGELARLGVSAREIELSYKVKQISEQIAEAEKQVEEARAALDACNKKYPSTSCQPPTGSNVLPGNGGAAFSGGTQPPVGGPTGPGPGATGGPGTPPVTPPSGTAPPGGGEIKPAPPPDAVPISTGPFAALPITRRLSFGVSIDAGFVTDQAPFIGVFPSTDTGLLRGSHRINTTSWHLGFDPPGWLWDLGGMEGRRSTSAQVPVGTESGWVYHVAAPNGSTGLSSMGGANATLRTKYEDQHLNLTLPSTSIKDEGDWKVMGEPAVGFRHSRVNYRGMISNLSAPDISSTTDQNVKGYDLRAGYGIHAERTFANRLVGSLGVGAEAIFYHAEYDGTQDNVCPVCSAATQNFAVSTSDRRNRLSGGVSSTAGFSYPVSENASIFLIGAYRYEFGVPTLVNKITPTDAAPHLGRGGREFASGQFGFEVRF